jgi:hypothetical protein
MILLRWCTLRRRNRPDLLIALRTMRQLVLCSTAFSDACGPPGRQMRAV